MTDVSMVAEKDLPYVALLIHGGSCHGAFVWGVLDRLLEEVAAGKLCLSVISSTGAGAINAALVVSGLSQGGPDLAREKLYQFWRAVARRGYDLGNFLFCGEHRPFSGFQGAWTRAVIALESAGVLISPFTSPFSRDALAALLDIVFLPRDLAALHKKSYVAPQLFIKGTNETLYSRHNISKAVLHACASLPTELTPVLIGGAPWWDGGYVVTPVISPLLDYSDDLIMIAANPLQPQEIPVEAPPGILARLNECAFQLYPELDGIELVNKLIREGYLQATRYKLKRLHAIKRAFSSQSDSMADNDTSWGFLSALRDEGYKCAFSWFALNGGSLGIGSSLDYKGLQLSRRTRSIPS